MLTCSVGGCEKRRHAKGYCGRHYMRWKTHGDPLAGGTPHGEPARFLQNVVLKHHADECLPWPFAQDTYGYAQIRVNGGAERVHVIVCTLVKGARPTPEHEVAHSCGKGHEACVAMAHLSWKTHAENQSDMREHGTAAKGEDCNLAKLTEEEIRHVRLLRSTGALHREIADVVGTTRSNIGAILSRKSWDWLG